MSSFCPAKLAPLGTPAHPAKNLLRGAIQRASAAIRVRASSAPIGAAGATVTAADGDVSTVVVEAVVETAADGEDLTVVAEAAEVVVIIAAIMADTVMHRSAVLN